MPGYLRFPALSKNHLAFVGEDALWIASRDGGEARRLTAGAEHVTDPCFAGDGRTLAFTSDAEGRPQVYALPVEGGVPRRVTAEASGCTLVGFHPDGRIVFRSEREATRRSFSLLYAVAVDGSGLERLPLGRALHVSFAADGDRVALGMNRVDIAYWKRYGGGMHGDVWAGSVAAGEYRRIVDEAHNAVLPQVVGERVWFISDADGHGNLWSAALSGGDERQHTRFRDYYPRHLARCGSELVFAKGADLFSHDTELDETRPLSVSARESGVHLVPKFVDAESDLQELDLAPDGNQIACTVRGKALVARAWGGSVRLLGRRSGVRYRLPAWLPVKEGDAKELVLVSDDGGEEGIEVFAAETGERTARLEPEGLGRIVHLWPAPSGRKLAVADIRGQLSVIDLDAEGAPSIEPVARSEHGEIQSAAWSPDGRWLAWVKPLYWLLEGGILHLTDLETGAELALNEPETPTHAPAFDPKGRFLYCLSDRTFNPFLDRVQFGAACLRTTRVYAYVLSSEELSPFDPRWAEKQESADDDEKKKDKGKGKGGEKDGKDDETPEPKPVRVDLEGLVDRVVEFPDIEPGTYTDLSAYADGVLYLDHPLLGLREEDDWAEEATERNLPDLCAFELVAEKSRTIQEHVREYRARGEKTLMRTHSGLRLLKSGEEPAEEPSKEGKNRHTGWIDLARLHVEVIPADEWRQMLTEAWRMQRDFFWDEGMSGIDWPEVLEHYLPILERVSTRAELSDLIWELQGELGTSHAYEIGGDYPDTKQHPVGLLGCDFVWDGTVWRVERVLEGDSWARGAGSPLRAPGVGISAGDALLAIDGRRLDERITPWEALVHRAGDRVELLVAPGSGADAAEPRRVVVESLRSEAELRNRDWVLRNRRAVLEASEGRLGYLYLTDMSGDGLAEFFRAFRTESKREGLVVDVRSNGGGFVSELVINMLRREVIGYDRPRYASAGSYPTDAVRGPIVALCDQFAGSDGDMFSHAFKRYGLGKLVGKRTWGGVIGIDLNGSLADGTIVTQPEYAFTFTDVGWGIENRGVDPDIEVDLDPASIAGGRDPQLDRAIQVALEELATDPVAPPRFDAVPSRRVELSRE